MEGRRLWVSVDGVAEAKLERVQLEAADLHREEDVRLQVGVALLRDLGAARREEGELRVLAPPDLGLDGGDLGITNITSLLFKLFTILLKDSFVRLVYSAGLRFKCSTSLLSTKPSTCLSTVVIAFCFATWAA